MILDYILNNINETYKNLEIFILDDIETKKQKVIYYLNKNKNIFTYLTIAGICIAILTIQYEHNNKNIKYNQKGGVQSILGNINTPGIFNSIGKIINPIFQFIKDRLVFIINTLISFIILGLAFIAPIFLYLFIIYMIFKYLFKNALVL
jgi:hypothetical protein